MEFKVSTAGYLYQNVAQMEQLAKIGFSFKHYKGLEYIISGEPTVKISSLEELVRFTTIYGEVIVGKDTIVIYDDYLE